VKPKEKSLRAEKGVHSFGDEKKKTNRQPLVRETGARCVKGKGGEIWAICTGEMLDIR